MKIGQSKTGDIETLFLLDHDDEFNYFISSIRSALRELFEKKRRDEGFSLDELALKLKLSPKEAYKLLKLEKKISLATIYKVFVAMDINPSVFFCSGSF